MLEKNAEISQFKAQLAILFDGMLALVHLQCLIYSTSMDHLHFKVKFLAFGINC